MSIGINSFKVFMAYKDVFMLRDNEIIDCFKVNICRKDKIDIELLVYRLSRK